ncbi:hypothetical protein K0M31_002173 [Melipona bicolor]|uniref:Uncharacterized protein n=1 Tax=Melipona bicolor TaxID=60889 RepID=A0AA40KYK0_9HYME|nr:hypothetical protein K0M31_002173 [Melipona bicolor]
MFDRANTTLLNVSTDEAVNDLFCGMRQEISQDTRSIHIPHLWKDESVLSTASKEAPSEIVSVPRFLSRDATRYSIEQKLEPDSHWPDLATRTIEIII